MVGEEALIQAVLRLRVEAPDLTAAAAFAALEVEGMKVTKGDVKKACSKATKRAPPPKEKPASTEPQVPVASSAKQAKLAKAAAAELKAVETAMMQEQKRLRERWVDDGQGRAPPTESKAFIQFATGRALSGARDEDEALSKERMEADIATLDWMILADQQGQMVLPDEARENARQQLGRLKLLRDVKAADFAAAAAKLYTVVPAEEEEGAGLAPVKPLSNFNDVGSLDREMARSGMLAANMGGDSWMEEQD